MVLGIPEILGFTALQVSKAIRAILFASVLFLKPKTTTKKPPIDKKPNITQ